MRSSKSKNPNKSKKPLQGLIFFFQSENNLVLTDPAFSTPHGKGFGGGNMKAAMSTFFKEHKCNWICHTLMGEGAKKNLLQP